MSKVLVILGHPRKASFCGALAQAYGEAARAAGAEVRALALADLPFDPVLHEGYSRSQALEASLELAQVDVSWADHLVFVYPNWWGGFPALLKGFFDRTFLPGYAFKYSQDSPLPKKLLSGRSARVLVTMDSPPWYYRWLMGAPGDRQIRRTILEFCGVKPVRIAHFGSIKASTRERRAAWLTRAAELGRRDASRRR